jgi:hypothetical protein
MKEANVSQGETKMDKIVRRRDYPAYVVQGHCMKCESFVVRCHWRWKEKSDEE